MEAELITFNTEYELRFRALPDLMIEKKVS